MGIFTARRTFRSSPHQSMNTGATLMELMVVIGIILIMAAIAVPGMRGYTERKLLPRTAEKLASELDHARDLAMDQGCPWRVSFNPEHGSWFSYGDTNDNARRDQGEDMIGPFTLEHGLSFGCLASRGPNSTSIPADGVNFANDEVRFSPMGTCVAGTIYLKDSRTSMALRLLSASGLVKIWQYRDAWEAVK